MLIRTAPRFWIWGCHRFEKLPDGCRDMAISRCLAPNMFLRHTESVVETEQMSSAETSVLSQQKPSVLSRQQILCVSDICSGRDTSKSPYLDNRRVTFQTDGTPKSGIAVRFQWTQYRGELLKNRKDKMARCQSIS